VFSLKGQVAKIMVDSGIWDLRGVDLEQLAIKSNGYWEFYWGNSFRHNDLFPVNHWIAQNTFMFQRLILKPSMVKNFPHLV
jgi:hypothetical protein